VKRKTLASALVKGQRIHLVAREKKVWYGGKLLGSVLQKEKKDDQQKR